MDDYAAYLAEEAKSDIAAMHQFRILYDPKQSYYHFFFEGEEDSLFYMPDARRRTRKEIHVYDCGGKKNVMNVRDAIKSDGYILDGCLFFVDRDFDDYLKSQVLVDGNTYITDNYSVENDLTSMEAARVLLADVLRISRADPEFSRIERFIVQGYQAFDMEVRTLIGWILAAKEEKCKPNLRNTNGLKDIVVMVGGKPVITRKGFIEFKKKVVSKGRIPSLATILKWRRALDLSNARQWVRGKYDLWFFHSVVLAALGEANTRRKAAGGRVIPIPASLREGKIFEILGGRVPLPVSLQTFYDLHLH